MLERLGTLYRANQQYDQAVYTFRPDLDRRIPTSVREWKRRSSRPTVLLRTTPRPKKKAMRRSAKYPATVMLAEVRSEVLGDMGKNDEAVAELRKLLNGPNDREVYVEHRVPVPCGKELSGKREGFGRG